MHVKNACLEPSPSRNACVLQNFVFLEKMHVFRQRCIFPRKNACFSAKVHFSSKKCMFLDKGAFFPRKNACFSAKVNVSSKHCMSFRKVHISGKNKYSFANIVIFKYIYIYV